MKKFDLPGAAINGALCICMGMASAGCLATAFSMEASLVEAVFACIFWAILGCGVLQLRRGWIAVVACLLLWWQLLWSLGTYAHFGSLLRKLLEVCSMGYGIRVPQSLLQYSGSVTLALSAIAGTVSLLVGVSLTKLRSGTLAITFCALPIVPCFMVTDTVPHEFFLFLLLICIGVILLSHGVRERDPRQASRLAAMLLLPIVLCSAWLFRANPRQTFDKQPENVFDYILNHWIAPMIPTVGPIDPGFTFQPSFSFDPSIPNISISDVNLQFVGPKKDHTNPVMEVQTELNGSTLYLRGKSYRDYNGKSWCAPALAMDTLDIKEETWEEGKYLLRITTVEEQDFQYVAYYPTDVSKLTEGVFENPAMKKQYSMMIRPLREDWQRLYLKAFPGMTLGELEQINGPFGGFSDLPDWTRTQAERILRENGISGEAHVVDAANAIADFVRNSASYSLNTSYMPATEKDFAIWFLEESDTGYCVHFASAAVVLLRAAGIPARYVEGYMVQTDKYGLATVTGEHGHAWVEYWLPELGWVIMEPTPAAGSSPPPPTTGPTVPATDPTVPTTKPVAPTTDPMVPTTKPVAPTTDPTVPTTKPVAPTTDPTVPTTKPVAPTTDPTAPATDPTAPTAGATEPSSESTAPTTGATEPSAPIEPPCGDPPEEQEDPKKDLSRLWATLQTALVLLLMAGAVIGQWQLRLHLRKKWLCNGSTNAQTLRRWYWTRRLAMMRRQDAPAALKELAQKAKFSQHVITAEELAAFDGYFERSVAHLKSRPIYLRLVYRLLLAAY